MGSSDMIRWLRTHCKIKTLLPYVKSHSEYKQHQEFKNVFINFDFDGSQTLDVEEVTEMLQQNNINIPQETLIKLFSVVDPKKPKELCLDEFISFSNDPVANKKFRRLI